MIELVYRVHAVNERPANDKNARHLRVQIGPACEWPLDTHALTCDGAGQTLGGDILLHVARLQSRDDDAVMPLNANPLDFGVAEDRALADQSACQPHRVNRDGA